MGSVSAGLDAMAWSPDQDLVVFVTRDQKLLLMTREFDPVTEVAMCPEEFGEGKDQLRSSSTLKLLHFLHSFLCSCSCERWLGSERDTVPWLAG